MNCVFRRPTCSTLSWKKIEILSVLGQALLCCSTHSHCSTLCSLHMYSAFQICLKIKAFFLNCDISMIFFTLLQSLVTLITQFVVLLNLSSFSCLYLGPEQQIHRLLSSSSTIQKNFYTLNCVN